MDAFDNFFKNLAKLDGDNHQQFIQLVNKTSCPYLHQKFGNTNEVHSKSCEIKKESTINKNKLS